MGHVGRLSSCANVKPRMTNEEYGAMDLFEALENMLGDWYLFCLAEISRDQVNEGSARETMKILKRLQGRYRVKDKSLAIGQKPK